MKHFLIPPSVYKFPDLKFFFVSDTLDVRYTQLVAETIQNLAKSLIWKRFLI